MEIIWDRFVEKTGGQKSRATVPLRDLASAAALDYLGDVVERSGLMGCT